MRKFLPLLMFAFASLTVAVPVAAQEPASIVQARRAGLIGERFDGYLGFVTPNVPAELHRQVHFLIDPAQLSDQASTTFRRLPRPTSEVHP